jgi:hypothetical protein
MSIQSRCAAPTTGACIDAVTRSHGGRQTASIRSRWPESCGKGRGSAAHEGNVSRPCSAPACSRVRIAPPPVSIPQAPINQSRPQGRSADDLISTNRCQSEECSPKHRAENRGGQAAVAARCPTPWLTAETVIDGLEDSEDYRACEAAVVADYDPDRSRTRVRAAARPPAPAAAAGHFNRDQRPEDPVGHRPANIEACVADNPSNRRESPVRARYRHLLSSSCSGRRAPRRREASDCTAFPISVRDLTCCFLRSNVGDGVFDRLGCYNAALLEQASQTLFLLQTVRRPLL